MRIMTIRECKKGKYRCDCDLMAVYEDAGKYYCSCCKSPEDVEPPALNNYSEADYQTWMRV